MRIIVQVAIIAMTKLPSASSESASSIPFTRQGYQAASEAEVLITRAGTPTAVALLGDVFDDDRARADGGVLADRATLDDLRTQADECAVADPHAPGECGRGADMRGCADLAFVVDDAGGVEDDGVADV